MQTQEDEGVLTQECRSLLQTLPSEKGWLTPRIYLYRGFWYEASHINGLISVQRKFQANHSDILLATTPKAGTTWLKALLFALVNRSKYDTNNRTDHPLLRNNPHELVPFLEITPNLKKCDPNLRLFSTHIPFSSLPGSIKSSKCKIVYLCRNPKDTFISLWHFSNKLRSHGLVGMAPLDEVPIDEAFDKFCRGVGLFGPFWDHALEYWKASQEMPHNVMFLKYEEIKKQPCELLKRLADFLGRPFSVEEEANGKVEEILKLCSFESLSKMEVNKSGELPNGIENNSFFRRGKVGDSANYLTQDMIKRLDRITEEKFKGSNLKL